jgi:anti-sigma28 factor (negative regulator of flagellin synthesis)
MIINRGDSLDVTSSNVGRSAAAQEVDTQAASKAPPVADTSVNDQIALSLATNYVQQATSAGSAARLERILALKHAIQAEQYLVEPNAVSHALIRASLLGE